MEKADNDVGGFRYRDADQPVNQYRSERAELSELRKIYGFG
jgi:hypothetical protein